MKTLFQVLGYRPDDSRLHSNRHTNTVFPITRFSSREEVEQRREELRFNLRMAAGLYPWPEKTPLETKVEDVGVFDGYAVKKIMFASRPGFWSTGNLYLPDPMPEKAPAILNVIGHWTEQRLHRSDAADYPRQLANFARMGFICLVTDMIGMVDSRQISHQYGGGEKELWCSNGLGVQLWNNIRALDLLCSMPEVDAENIGVTGASGGGSQTLFLSLLDERIKAAAPINMISLHMQGGCPCENAPGLRRHTDNTEMCAMLAPRALFLAGSDGDWTNYLETAELPAVLEAYRQYGADDMVEHFYQIAPHQYNHKTRSRVYNFFARHLMGKDICWEEQPLEVKNLDSLTWFPGEGRAPGFANDEEFFAAHRAERTAAAARLSAEEKRKMLAWVTGIRKNDYRLIPISAEETDHAVLKRGIVYGDQGEKLPIVQWIPANWDGKRVCLALSGSGKDCLDREELRKMLADGVLMVSGDLFGTGEFAGHAGSGEDQQYFTTFNYPPAALRAQDAALLLDVASRLGSTLTVWAEGSGVGAALCALALDSGKAKTVLLEKGMQEEALPGIGPLGGLAGCLSLIGCEADWF